MPAQKGSSSTSKAVAEGPLAADTKDELPEQSRCKLIFFMFIMCCGAFGNGYTPASANQLANTLNEKYDWESNHE